MIRKLKKQLSNPAFCAILCLCLLAGFFVYAVAVSQAFFLAIFFTHLMILIFLLAIRHRYSLRRAKLELERQDFIEQSNVLHADIIRERIAVESFQEKIVSYSQLKSLTEKLSQCLSLSDTSRALSAEANELFAGKDATTILYLFHSATGGLGLSFSQKGQMRVNIKSKKGDLFDEWVVKALQPLLVEDARNDFRFDAEKIGAEEDARPVRSVISVPLMIGKKALGILRVDSATPSAFTAEDLRFLSTIGELGAVAIENAQLYERIEELAIKDGLTGLYLRRYLLSRMNEEISRQLKRKKELSFLMIDLDRFKNYNDKFGHIAGDIVLKTIGMILQETFSDPAALVSRYGGEEFAVLLPDSSKDDAIKAAEELRKRIKKQEIILRKQKMHITVSIGVATFPTDAQIKDDLILVADNALYKAKSGGRDRICFI